MQSHTGNLVSEHQSIPLVFYRNRAAGIDDGKPFRLACARPNRSFEKEDL